MLKIRVLSNNVDPLLSSWQQRRDYVVIGQRAGGVPVSGRVAAAGRPPGAVVRAWCPKRIQRGRPVSKGNGSSGMTRGDRRRNERRERLRGLLPRDGVVIGIDLAEEKQAIAVAGS